MEDPTVVLLTVGEDSGVLREEIEKKGLRVISCAFSEAEEVIEQSDPLLIVLEGSRGAVELSTLLEDSAAEHPQKVAVVAPRKELAQLMGLNRDIVIGLVALEMTEKTAAARIEALVRQTAKQRGVQINLAARRMSMGPRPSLGARPSAEASKKPMVLDAPTPGIGQNPGLLGRASRGGPAGDERARGEPEDVPEAPAPPDLRPVFSGKESGGKSSNMMAEPGDIPGAPRMPGETAIGLPHAPKRSRREPFPLDGSAPRESREKEPGAEDSRDAGPARPRNLKKTLVGVAGPPGAAPEKVGSAAEEESPFDQSPVDLPTVGLERLEEPASLDLDEIDSIVPESLNPSEMVSMPPEDSEDGPEVPRAGALPNFDPSELLSDTSDDELPTAQVNRNVALSSLSDESAADDAEPSSPEQEEDFSGMHPGSAEIQEGDSAFSTRSAGGSERLFSPDDATPTGVSAEALASSRGEEAFGAGEALPFGATIAEPPRSPLSDEPAGSATEAEEEEPPLPPEATLPPPATAEDFDGDEGPPVRAQPVVEGDAEQGPRKKSKGGGLVVAAIVLIAGGAAGAYYYVGQASHGGAGRTVATSEPRAEATSVPRSGDASADEPSRTEPETGDAASDEAGEPEGTGAGDSPVSADVASAASADGGSPDGEGSEGASPDGASSEAEGTPPDEEQAGGDAPSSSRATTTDGGRTTAVESFVRLVEEPFKTPDAKLPGCDELAPSVKAETNDPVTEASTHWAAARKLIVKGDIRGASQAMCMAVGINPESPANEGLARLYALAYSPAQAMIWVEKALAIAPDDRNLIGLRGDIQSQLGNQEGATEDWLRALGLEPGEDARRKNQAREYAVSARKLRSVGDLPKAEQFFRRALGLDPENITALAGIADVLLARELYDHAGTFAVRALEVFEAMPETHLVLGDIALAKNQPQAARASYQRALAIRPDFWPAKKRLSDLSK